MPKNSVPPATVLVVGSFRTDGTPCGITTSMRNFSEAPIVRQRLKLIEANTFRPAKKRGPLQKAAFGARLTAGIAFTILRERVSAVDIHTASGPDFLKHVAVVLAARATRTPVLLRIHGGDFENNFRTASSSGKWATRWALRHASQVVALSEGWAQKFLATEPDAKVVAIPNSVDCSHFSSLGAERPKRSRRVLMLANLCEMKGHFTLLDALPEVVKRHPDCVVKLAGAERDEGARALLEQKARDLGVKANVEFCGAVSGARKDALFREAELFILPSHTENMPVSIVEAMASGLPVIATRVGAIPEMVDHERTGILIEPRSVSELARAIVDLLDHSEKAQALGALAQKVAKERWDQDAVATKSLRVLDALL